MKCNILKIHTEEEFVDMMRMSKIIRVTMTVKRGNEIFECKKIFLKGEWRKVKKQGYWISEGD